MPGTQYYLDRQARTESNARTYARRFQLAIRRAEGLYVTDMDGRVFMDCLCGAGTLALGHNHPVVIAAIRRHLDEGYPLHTLDLTTPVKDEFVHELLGTLPPEFGAEARIQFCSPSGADAVEAALKLVKTATRREAIISFSGGWHGQTHGALALMGEQGPKVPGLMPNVHFQPYPYQYRCPMGERPCADCRCADYTEIQLADSDGGVPHPAGIILEVVQGEGGAIPSPAGWLRQIRQLATRRGIPLILDEVQTGWGRTGTLYAFEHAGVMPDVLVLSKAIGGGLPLAVIVYRRELDVWQPGAHTGTFRGNQLAMAAGLATLRFIREQGLCARAAEMGELLMSRLRDLRSCHHFVGDVRGRGLMIGVEIVDPDAGDRFGRPRGDGELARRIQAECFRRGLIVELGGRRTAVMRLLPPLTVTAGQVEAICDVIGAAFAAVGSRIGPRAEAVEAQYV
jgi:diaminobutyrate-2-oxoglutarate transaminase